MNTLRSCSVGLLLILMSTSAFAVGVFNMTVEGTGVLATVDLQDPGTNLVGVFTNGAESHPPTSVYYYGDSMWQDVGGQYYEVTRTAYVDGEFFIVEYLGNLDHGFIDAVVRFEISTTAWNMTGTINGIPFTLDSRAKAKKNGEPKWTLTLSWDDTVLSFHELKNAVPGSSAGAVAVASSDVAMISCTSNGSLEDALLRNPDYSLVWLVNEFVGADTF